MLGVLGGCDVRLKVKDEGIDELDALARKVLPAVEYLAWRADVEGISPPQRANQWVSSEEMAGILECRLCLRPIRDHAVTEWCSR
jgi:hypothetical protein